MQNINQYSNVLENLIYLKIFIENLIFHANASNGTAFK